MRLSIADVALALSGLFGVPAYCQFNSSIQGVVNDNSAAFISGISAIQTLIDPHTTTFSAGEARGDQAPPPAGMDSGSRRRVPPGSGIQTDSGAIRELEALVPSKPEVVKRRKAS